jgi:hypothetical protein
MLVPAFLLHPLILALPFFAEEVSEKQAAYTPSARDADGDQQTNQSAILAAALFLILLF